MAKLFNTQPWYISHIILDVALALGIGFHLGKALHIFNLFGLTTGGIIASHIVKLIWYSFWFYLVDSLYHGLSGND